MKTLIVSLAVLVIISPLPLMAQTKLAGTAGATNSINMGEIGPAPIFQGTFTIGHRFRFENGFEFSPIDKYTHAGWYLKDRIHVLYFLPSSKTFLIGGADYGYRNGGTWAKDGVRVGFGGGYENMDIQYRFFVRKTVASRNDNVKYSPYFEFLSRRDYKLGDSVRWKWRTESQFGVFKFTQNNTRATALYVHIVVGLVYKWP